MRTRPMQRLYLSFVLLLVLAVALSACVAPAAPTASAPAAGDAPAAAPAPAEAAMPHVLKVANTANITTWDPVASFSTEAAYMANMYEQLLRINPPGSAETYTPLLATSWASNEDGTSWTFSLRDGVTFHDGEALTADAVKMSIEAGSTQGGASFIWWALDTIEVVDDLTVTFNFTSPTPMDLVASSLYGSWIISPKALEAAAADAAFWEMGVEAGTGPYMLESYTPDQEILLTAFADYWGGWSEGQFDKVLVQIVPEAVLQQQMLEGGEVDLVTRIPQENYATFEDNPDYTVLVEPSFFNYVGFFNTLRAPLDNPMVRQALSYAIPYEDIITIGAQGLGTQSRGPVPAGVWPWSPDVPQYTYDLDKAKGHAGRGRLPGWRLQPEPDLRRRERHGGSLRPPDQGRLRPARRGRQHRAHALQPAVGALQGGPGQCPGYVPAALLAHLFGCRARTTSTPCSTAARSPSST